MYRLPIGSTPFKEILQYLLSTECKLQEGYTRRWTIACCSPQCSCQSAISWCQCYKSMTYCCCWTRQHYEEAIHPIQVANHIDATIIQKYCLAPSCQSIETMLGWPGNVMHWVTLCTLLGLGVVRLWIFILLNLSWWPSDGLQLALSYHKRDHLIGSCRPDFAQTVVESLTGGKGHLSRIPAYWSFVA